MTEFISIPVIVGLITFGIYKLFELFVRRKERIMLIEKIGVNVDPTVFDQQFSFNNNSSKSFGTLKIACLLLGVGLGLLVGFFILTTAMPNIMRGEQSWVAMESAGLIYGASVLLFGGAGLLVAFFLEQKYIKEEKQLQNNK